MFGLWGPDSGTTGASLPGQRHRDNVLGDAGVLFGGRAGSCVPEVWACEAILGSNGISVSLRGLQIMRVRVCISIYIYMCTHMCIHIHVSTCVYICRYIHSRAALCWRDHGVDDWSHDASILEALATCLWTTELQVKLIYS